jgi:hypothetical protein
VVVVLVKDGARWAEEGAREVLCSPRFSCSRDLAALRQFTCELH